MRRSSLLRALPRIVSDPLALSHPAFEKKYGYVLKGQTCQEEVILRGRVASKRVSGKKLLFYDIVSCGQKMQTVVRNCSAEVESKFKSLSRGDHVEIRGIPGRTDSGAQSIFASDVARLSHCHHRIPEVLTDVNTRTRYRHIDFLVNRSSYDTILQRSQIITALRSYLNELDFVELETPVLQSSASGATARPFETTSVLDMDLQLKIAPELALKRAVIGGFDRVYEIGKCFRNEGLSKRHNPEFTTCEFYQAYASLEDLMDMTEDLLLRLQKSIQNLGTERAPVFVEGEKFQRLDFLETMESRMGQPLPRTRPELLALFESLFVEVPADDSIANLYDVLATKYLEPLCTKPTFIYNHPAILSPLSKSTAGIAHRFELFVHRMEIANAYEEENDPVEQRLKFLAQNPAGLTPEEEYYCKALEWGMPPTGGWGLGIDRLVMLLTGNTRISDVLLFGGIGNQPKSENPEPSKKSLEQE